MKAAPKSGGPKKQFHRRVKLISGREALSPREKTALLHLSDGLHVDAIAERMSVSETSVKALVAQAMGKLEARSRVHAVALAVRRRLI